MHAKLSTVVVGGILILISASGFIAQFIRKRTQYIHTRLARPPHSKLALHEDDTDAGTGTAAQFVYDLQECEPAHLRTAAFAPLNVLSDVLYTVPSKPIRSTEDLLATLSVQYPVAGRPACLKLVRRELDSDPSAADRAARIPSAVLKQLHREALSLGPWGLAELSVAVSQAELHCSDAAAAEQEVRQLLDALRRAHGAGRALDAWQRSSAAQQVSRQVVAELVRRAVADVVGRQPPTPAPTTPAATVVQNAPKESVPSAETPAAMLPVAVGQNNPMPAIDIGTRSDVVDEPAPAVPAPSPPSPSPPPPPSLASCRLAPLTADPARSTTSLTLATPATEQPVLLSAHRLATVLGTRSLGAQSLVPPSVLASLERLSSVPLVRDGQLLPRAGCDPAPSRCAAPPPDVASLVVQRESARDAELEAAERRVRVFLLRARRTPSGPG